MSKIISILRGLIQYWAVYLPLLKWLTSLTKFNWDDKALKIINDKINEGLKAEGVEDWVKESVAKKLDAEAKRIANVSVGYDANTKKVSIGLKKDDIMAEINGNELKIGWSGKI